MRQSWLIAGSGIFLAASLLSSEALAVCKKLPCAVGPLPKPPPKPKGPTFVPVSSNYKSAESFRRALEAYRSELETSRADNAMADNEYRSALDAYQIGIKQYKTISSGGSMKTLKQNGKF